MKLSYSRFAHSLIATTFAFAALTAAAQSTSTNSTQSTPRASERAKERANERSAVHGTKAHSKADQKFVEKFTESNNREMALAQLGAQRATNPQVKQFAQRLVTEHQKMTSEFMASVHGGANIAVGASGSGRTAASTSGTLRGSTGTIDSGSASVNPPQHAQGTSGSTASGDTRRAQAASASDASGHPIDRNRQTSTTVSKSTSATSTSDGLSASTGMSGSAMATPDMSNDRHVRALMDKKQGEDFDKAWVKRMVKEHEEAVKLLEKATEDKDHGENIRAFANKHLPSLRDHLRQAKQLEDTLD